MIERIVVEKAGPLNKTELKFGRANLVTGLNESGKTTLVDIITAFLMGRMKKVHDRNNFQKITGAGTARYGGSENWEYEIRGELIPPDGGDFNALSLLFVRSNRNLIQDKNARGVDSVSYWKQTAGAIMSGSTSSPKLFRKLKDYTNTNKQIWAIVERLSGYRDFLNRKKGELNEFEKARNRVDRSEDRLNEINARLETLRKARIASDFREMESLYKEYCELSDRTASLEKELSGYDPEAMNSELQEWEKLETRENEIKSEINRLMLEIQRFSGESTAAERSIQEKKAMAGDLSERIASMESKEFDFNSARKKIDALTAERDELNRKASSTGRIPLSAAILAGAGIVSLAGVVVSPWAALLSLAFILAGAFLFTVDLRKRKKVQDDLNMKISTIENEINTARTALMIQEAGADRDLKAREELKRNLSKLKKEIEELENSKEKSDLLLKENKSKKDRLDAELQKIDGLLKEKKSKHESRISLASKTATLKNRRDALNREKAGLEKMDARIRYLFETDNTAPSNLYAILENRKTQVDFSIEEDYNEEEYQNLVSEKESLTGDSYDFKSRYSSLKTGILSEASSFLKSVRERVPKEKVSQKFYDLYMRNYIDDLELADLTELDFCIERVNNALEHVLSLREFLGVISEAVAEVESRQDSIIESVVAGSEFKNCFSRLAGYNDVDFSIDREDDKVYFTIGESSYGLHDLSAGALDQFYFSFRIALLDQIFEKPSTLILDDAFIHFDRKRRREAVSLLKDLVAGGWQFIYSAVDDGMIEGVFTEIFGDEVKTISLDVK